MEMEELFEITTDELEKRSDVVTIDVREDVERQQVYLKDSIHIPMQTIPANIDKLKEYSSSSETVVIICQHGMRSLDTAMYLKQNGIENVLSLQGGLAQWYADDKEGLVFNQGQE